METLYKIASSVGTPLALAGVVVAVLAQLFLAIIKSPKLRQAEGAVTGDVFKRILTFVFILALVSIFLGVAAWGYAKYAEHQKEQQHRAERLDAIKAYGDLVTVLRNETDRLILEYPRQLNDILKSGSSAAQAKEKLRFASRRNIDSAAAGDKTFNMLVIAFPELEWEFFFRMGRDTSANSGMLCMRQPSGKTMKCTLACSAKSDVSTCTITNSV